jgi:DNA-directed RNA polymerase specialized sigma24 family protein
MLRDYCREQPTDDVEPPSAALRWGPADDAGPETAAVRRDQQVLVRRAVDTLPPRQRALLGLLVSSPPVSYEEISAGLGIPVGSIGPTRARILARLRTTLETAGVHDLALNTRVPGVPAGTPGTRLRPGSPRTGQVSDRRGGGSR